MNSPSLERFVNAIASDLEEGGFREVTGTTLRRNLTTAVQAALPLLSAQAGGAARSAQPSPGGQGDALELLEAYDQAVEDLSAERSGGCNEDNRRPQLEADVSELRTELIAALAARQPVWCGACWQHGVDHEEGCIRQSDFSRRTQSGEWGPTPDAGTQADFCKNCDGSGWDGESREAVCPTCSGGGIAARQPVCGTCDEAIQPDAMTGTKCACSRLPTAWLIEWNNGVTALTKDSSEAEQHRSIKNCTVVPVFSARQPVGEPFAYTRATTFVDPLPVITPAEYTGLRAQGLGELYRALGFEDAPPPAQAIFLERYDAGLLSDVGGGDTAWWLNYLRSELGRAHDHYQHQVNPAKEAGHG